LSLDFVSDNFHDTMKAEHLIKTVGPNLIFPGSDIVVNSFLFVNLESGPPINIDQFLLPILLLIDCLDDLVPF
jgi:hypothetical protein